MQYLKGFVVKILYIVEDYYPPYRVDVVELFAKSISKKGYKIEWLMRCDTSTLDCDNIETWHGQKVHLFKRNNKRGLLGKLVKNINSILFDLKILSLSLKNNYEIIQVRDRYVAGIVAYFAARLSNSKFIFWMSYPYPESKIYQAKNKYVPYPLLTYYKGKISKIILYKIVLKLADYIFVQSDEMLANVSSYGVSKEKMTAVPMGVKDEVLEFPLSEVSINTKAPNLLYLGGISRIRKTEILVDILSEVKIKYPNAVLTYVGDGQREEDKEIIYSSAERLGIKDSILITGNLSMDQAWEYVKNSDICISPINPIPALLQASPTKLIEYMAFAKPVVANKHPEQNEIFFEGGLGDTVSWDVNDFSNKIISLLDNPNEAIRMAYKGRKYVKEKRVYSVIANKVIEGYDNLLNAN